ncbi:MAG TPA: peptidylprolyl isomerase [Steroidobacteraceae bacterium]|jgi:cyclophilin family peptidyl-prolyl cis-trans isomerase
MKQPLLTLALLGLVCLHPSFAAEKAAAEKAPVKPAPAYSPQVQVFTSMGNFTIELNAERAPLTVTNFLAYVDAGHYTNTLIHRVVSNFVIQGGGFNVDYAPKSAPLKVPNESGNGLSNVRGTVGLARTADPHGGNAQFYVNLNDNAALDPNATRWGYAVFGKVIDGMDVVDRIGNVATGAHGPLKEETPVKPVVILKIERATGSSGGGAAKP